MTQEVYNALRSALDEYLAGRLTYQQFLDRLNAFDSQRRSTT